MSQSNTSPTLLGVKQFAEKHSAFSQGGLRHLIFESESRETSNGRIDGNGLSPAIIRLGRRVLIDESKFFDWIQAQQAKRCVGQQGLE